MANESVTTHYRACHLCEAICGLRIDVDGQRIVAIKGDDNDPLSRGHICPKAIALQDLHQDPDRLRQPVRRVGEPDGDCEWEAIGWDEALDTVAEALVRIRAAHGDDSLAVYLGNPTVHNYGMLTHQGDLFRLLRTRNRYSATSVDQLPHHLAALWLYGHKQLLPVPDIDRSDYLLVLGGNPLASNGSLWTVPDVKHRIRDLQRRGGRLVVVDPRRTETAAVADRHHFIRPGTDALLLLALLATILREGLARPGKLATFTTGLDAVAAAVADFTPQAVAPATGMDAGAIESLARELAGAERACCYGRMGVSVQGFGALNLWLVNLLNIVTGNLDREGGSMFATPAVDIVSLFGPGGFDRYRSRVGSLPEFDRELPVVALADEILTPGEGQVRVLFTGAGNPVLSTPDGRRLEQALAQLEFMVSLDPYINETTRYADVILPPASPLEHDHYDLAFHGLAVRNTARMNQPIFPRQVGSLYDWEIFHQLALRVARLLGVSPPAGQPPAALVDMGLKMGPYGAAQRPDIALDLAKLGQYPSGIDLGPLQPQLPQRLCTKDKTIRCDAPEPMADIARARDLLAPRQHVSTLRLIGRRDVRSNNSWMHNFHRLVKGKPRCTLLMHPDDAHALDLRDGQQVVVRSRVGEVTAPLEISADMMPGVVSLPHGWGHGRKGVRMTTASRHAGVSCNDLTDAAETDRLSGNAVLNGVPVEVEALAASG